MIPSRILLYSAFAWLLLALFAALWRDTQWLWLGFGALLAAFALADFFASRARRWVIDVQRRLPGSLPVGVWHDVDLRISHSNSGTLVATLFDHYPSSCEVEGLPHNFALAPERFALAKYRVRPLSRGEKRFPHVELRIASPFRLWLRKYYVGQEQTVRVYPNFAEITHYALLAIDNRLSQLGILRRRRRGEGLEFHQLREYREGDSQRQIDWKATARMRKLISRDYQDERDQQIMFLIDCGRRMSAQDEMLSHFDHALNAVLLLSYVALRQGDAAGLMTFATETARFVAPRKAQTTVNVFLNTLYDLQPGPHTADYYRAAVEIAQRIKKRSLIVIISNLRDEDEEALLPAIRLLKRRHIVLFANLRERVVRQIMEKPVHDFTDALTYAAAMDYSVLRVAVQQRLQRSGARILDVEPERLAVSLVNRYLELKRAGAL